MLSQMTGAASKRLKTAPITIGTHNGCFHADEALAVYMLRLLPAYRNSQLVRTRDSELLDTCHTVVDVGGQYDATIHRFDHHQRTFTTTFPNRMTKLSSAGLVYMHHGKAIIAQNLGVGEDTAEVLTIWEKIYENFIEAVDAHDNGISEFDPAEISAAGIKKRYRSDNFTLGAMVGRLNPRWNDVVPEDPVEAQKMEDERFCLASEKIGEEFLRGLDYFTKSWLPAREIVHEAYRKRLECDPQGRVIIFHGNSPPWKDHLYTLEQGENAANPKVLYVLYPENTTVNSRWRIQCVPEAEGSFQSRKPLPEAWRGMRDEKLDEITGIDGGIFVHAAGFIGGNKTIEGAKAMTMKALEMC
ncbi:BgTH12-07898 [Blumeria graminis f. sp. triticale]|uniref:BgTH12-06378 n=1 Tax=Blumeria graminis f. sp. triticale TaxID=1689686 RepID=A0A9W4CY77_BLUGR|nr:BgTH12-06378 [Blumeria graminis f. sp. triticale]CAD6500671.1 BgTH12-07898 [Blumeria graminis f. sp. triticale]